MISVMEMVCVIEESGEVTILETVEAVIKVLLMEASALCVIAFIVTVEVGQQIPVNKDESISDKLNTNMTRYPSSGALPRHQQRRFLGSAKTPIMTTSSRIVWQRLTQSCVWGELVTRLRMLSRDISESEDVTHPGFSDIA